MRHHGGQAFVPEPRAVAAEQRVTELEGAIKVHRNVTEGRAKLIGHAFKMADHDAALYEVLDEDRPDDRLKAAAAELRREDA